MGNFKAIEVPDVDTVDKISDRNKPDDLSNTVTPVGTQQDQVKSVFDQLVAKGMAPKEAAKLIQEKTGLSAVTGSPIKAKKVNFTKAGVSYGGQFNAKRGASKSKFGKFR